METADRPVGMAITCEQTDSAVGGLSNDNNSNNICIHSAYCHTEIAGQSVVHKNHVKPQAKNAKSGPHYVSLPGDQCRNELINIPVTHLGCSLDCGLNDLLSFCL